MRDGLPISCLRTVSFLSDGVNLQESESLPLFSRKYVGNEFLNALSPLLTTFLHDVLGHNSLIFCCLRKLILSFTVFVFRLDLPF